MKHLFDETSIKNLNLKNRCIRSATHEGLATEDGMVSDELIAFLQHLAKEEIGLLISGHAYVDELGKASPRQLGVYSDACIAGLSKMTEAVHHENGSILLQLAHAGIAARSRFRDRDPINFSTITEEEIDKLIDLFARASARAKLAGFDGIQLHAAHGYFISQTLSPYFNSREDKYGGSIENRAAFLITLMDKMRDELGDAFPILVKLNSEDFMKGGFTQEDMLRVCSLLEQHGCDAIELSGGTPLSGDFMPIRKMDPIAIEQEGYYLSACKKYKEKIAIPLITVGGFRSYAACEKVIADNVCDYVSFSRPLIREPQLIHCWKEGNFKRASCISCNLCMRPTMTGKGLYCVQEKKQKDR